MTQADLEALPSEYAVGDRTIACEALAEQPQDEVIPESTVLDYAPESFWLSKDAEFDWFDRNAFLERKESIKGNSNSMNLSPIVNPSYSNANASSLSVFLKPKAAAQKTNYVDSKRRNCKLANILLFPKRLDSIGKEVAVVSMTEPSSPKVSCLGRVRSKKCHRRRKSSRPASEPEKPVTQSQKTDQVQKQKLGFISCVKSLFRSVCHGGRRTNKRPPETNEPSEYSARRRNNVVCNLVDDEDETKGDLPASGVTPFSSLSGRRRET